MKQLLLAAPDALNQGRLIPFEMRFYVDTQQVAPMVSRRGPPYTIRQVGRGYRLFGRSTLPVECAELTLQLDAQALGQAIHKRHVRSRQVDLQNGAVRESSISQSVHICL